MKYIESSTEIIMGDSDYSYDRGFKRLAPSTIAPHDNDYKKSGRCNGEDCSTQISGKMGQRMSMLVKIPANSSP